VYRLQFVARRSLELQWLKTEKNEGRETALLLVFYPAGKRPPFEKGLPTGRLEGSILGHPTGHENQEQNYLGINLIPS
jgi:hypothetical protein